MDEDEKDGGGNWDSDRDEAAEDESAETSQLKQPAVHTCVDGALAGVPANALFPFAFQVQSLHLNIDFKSTANGNSIPSKTANGISKPS